MLSNTNISKLKVNIVKLRNLLSNIEMNYSMTNYDLSTGYLGSINTLKIFNESKDILEKDNPYHNTFHAADVLQGVLFFSKTYTDLNNDFSALDFFSLLFAAYIHDFNHPGLNTNYVINDWPASAISTTFGTESPLEKHHLAYTFNLMRNQEDYNFLINESSEKTSYFRRIVTECVLATDLAKSMTWLTNARLILIGNNDVNNQEGVDKEKKQLEHKIYRMQLTMKCGDVGHPARPLELHLEWSKRICEEFYNQGDKERSRGVKISPLCDRNLSSPASYPQGQIGFINFVSKPVFSLLSAVCSSVDEGKKPWLECMDNNIKYWQNFISSNEISTNPSISGSSSSDEKIVPSSEQKKKKEEISFAENNIQRSSSVVMYLLFVSSKILILIIIISIFKKIYNRLYIYLFKAPVFRIFFISWIYQLLVYLLHQ